MEACLHKQVLGTLRVWQRRPATATAIRFVHPVTRGFVQSLSQRGTARGVANPGGIR